MTEDFLEFILDFNLLDSYENESGDVSDENSQGIEKKQKHRSHTLVDVKARATTSSTNSVVKVLKSRKLHMQIDIS